MIIFRLLSLIFTLCGLAVLVAAVWLLMGNKLEIPANNAFGEMPEAVTRTLAGERGDAGARAGPGSFGSSMRDGEAPLPRSIDGLFGAEGLPGARGAEPRGGRSRHGALRRGDLVDVGMGRRPGPRPDGQSLQCERSA